MSQFDARQQSQYVENLRVFLALPAKGFAEAYGLKPVGENRRGRLSTYPPDAVKAVECKVNAKAARVEAADSTLGERIGLARDYLGMSDAAVGRVTGVSREMVRRWRENISTPSDLPKLAQSLHVPLAWLESGGDAHLPADSALGVRVGGEGKSERERLFGLSSALAADDDCDDNWSEEALNQWIQQQIFERPTLRTVARRAGGRWLFVKSVLQFVPWHPLPDLSIKRRLWSDQVEAMITEELAAKPTTYGAWHSLKAKCEAQGITAYPKLVTLHKRVELEHKRKEKFGVSVDPK